MPAPNGRLFRPFLIYLGIVSVFLALAYAAGSYLLRDKKFYSWGGIAVPADQTDWIGRWQGDKLTLQIPRFGNVKYEEIRPGYTLNLDMPLQEISAASLKLGVAYWVTEIPGQQPPHLVNGQWHATMANIDLTRQ